MRLLNGKDKKGLYFQDGPNGKRFYYKPYDTETREIAKSLALGLSEAEHKIRKAELKRMKRNKKNDRNNPLLYRTSQDRRGITLRHTPYGETIPTGFYKNPLKPFPGPEQQGVIPNYFPGQPANMYQVKQMGFTDTPGIPTDYSNNPSDWSDARRLGGPYQDEFNSSEEEFERPPRTLSEKDFEDLNKVLSEWDMGDMPDISDEYYDTETGVSLPPPPYFPHSDIVDIGTVLPPPPIDSDILPAPPSGLQTELEQIKLKPASRRKLPSPRHHFPEQPSLREILQNSYGTMGEPLADRLELQRLANLDVPEQDWDDYELSEGLKKNKKELLSNVINSIKAIEISDAKDFGQKLGLSAKDSTKTKLTELARNSDSRQLEDMLDKLQQYAFVGYGYKKKRSLANRRVR